VLKTLEAILQVKVRKLLMKWEITKSCHVDEGSKFIRTVFTHLLRGATTQNTTF
jgi:hypothetical protein